MPLDDLARTRVTIENVKSIAKVLYSVCQQWHILAARSPIMKMTFFDAASVALLNFSGNLLKSSYQLGSTIAIIRRERGISSKRHSSNGADYVTTLCTHRPSLLPIATSGECLRCVFVSYFATAGNCGSVGWPIFVLLASSSRF